MELPKNLTLDNDQKWEISHFDEITNFLWDNRKKLIEDCWFDPPDYGGLPKKLYNRLRSDTVDAIRDAVAELVSASRGQRSKMTKKEFCNICAKYLISF